MAPGARDYLVLGDKLARSATSYIITTDDGS